MKWNKNMEEAPKDQNILVYDPEENRVVIVSWDQEIIYYPGCKPRWTWCVPGTHQDEQGGCDTVERPTGWMYLPTPPE